ncbi:MAG: DUF4184 family protein [Steroidobacterales bacterium]
MPFTVSHVAAVLPLYRSLARWHLFSAAVIGSMVPDFGMLLPGFWPRVETHGLGALLRFCLPVGLLTYWLTQLLVKPAVVEVLPDRQYLELQTTHPPVRPSDGRAWIYAGVTIVLGAVTHLLWDAFTHEDSRGVRMFPVLQDYGPEMGGHAVRLYRWLQHGSSVLGLLAVLIAIIVWARRAPQPPTAPARRLRSLERKLWGAMYLTIPAGAVLAAVAAVMMRGQPLFAASGALEIIAISGMRATILTLLATSLLLRVRLLH